MIKRKPDSWFVKKLVEMEACPAARQYARKHRTFAAAWNECIKRTWMMWLLTALDLYTPPNPGTAAHARCLSCNGTPDKIRRRFSAERVAKALRKHKCQ